MGNPGSHANTTRARGRVPPPNRNPTRGVPTQNYCSAVAAKQTKMATPMNPFFERTFHYAPLEFVAVAHASLFAAVTAVLLVLTLKHGGAFMYYAVFTGVVEALGYGLRAYCAAAPGLAVYITSTFMLLLGPITLALVNYRVVSILLAATGKKATFLGGRVSLSAKPIAKIFFISDVVCLFVQAGGGGLLAIADANANRVGTAIVLSGLAIQLVFFSGFTWILWQVATKHELGLTSVPSLRPVFSGLTGTIILLYIRNIFRVVEFASGSEGYAATHEWVFNVFETLPIFLALVLYAIYHFGKLLECRSDNPTWRAELNDVVLLKAQARREGPDQEQRDDRGFAVKSGDESPHFESCHDVEVPASAAPAAV